MNSLLFRYYAADIVQKKVLLKEIFCFHSLPQVRPLGGVPFLIPVNLF